MDEAVVAGRASVDLRPDDPGALSNLCGALQYRFELTGNRADLDAAIIAGRSAVAHAPADATDRGTYLANLGNSLRNRFEVAGDLADLEAAVRAGRASAAALPASHEDHGACLSNLGLAVLARFDHAGERSDLDEAVEICRAAVDVVAPDFPGRGHYLFNLATTLQTRFELVGDMADVDEAVRALRMATAGASASTDLGSRARYLSNLGAALEARCARAGGLADLNEAADAGRRALDLLATATVDHPDRAMHLSNLGLTLERRFDRTGDLADLDEAVTVGRAAVAAAGDGHHRAGTSGNLCGTLHARFARLGVLADLDEAIIAGRVAVAVVPDGYARHTRQARYLSNLGTALESRTERTGDLANLDEALTVLRAAASSTPAGHPDRAKYLSNLGLALQVSCERTGSLADLDEAVDVARGAVAAVIDVAADHPDRAMYLSNLGLALQIRFDLVKRPADLDEAIAASRDAVAAVPDGHPDQAMYLSNLGLASQVRYEHCGNTADLTTAERAGRQAAAVAVASPRTRTEAARGWGRASALGERWGAAVAGYTVASELLGQVAPRRLARSDQEHLLDTLGELGSEAAACCVHAGQLQRAVELFEQGRGVLLGQALDTRTDLTALAEQHPGLAERFAALREDLDFADRTRRPQLADTFEQLITQVRALPGFDRFLRPPQLRELAEAAADGMVVIVVVSRFGSQALIIDAAGAVEAVSLGELTPEAVEQRVNEFLAVLDDEIPLGDDWPSAEAQVNAMLAWLWDVLAEPVLERIGATGRPADGTPWPRLWWCPSGLLSFLPLHAAGRHETRDEPVPATVMDRVYSSYTPTVRALTHSRRRRPVRDLGEGSARSESMLAVSMPFTPGAADLRSARAETDRLANQLSDRVQVLTGPAATRQAVLAALPAARWVHFACHGYSDATDPSASRLLLHDHETEPLRVVDLARLRLDDAELAVLSACSTARPGQRLTDEAIHLAAACQLAGYRHVVATLWPVPDRPARRAVAAFYDRVFPDGGYSTDRVQPALHATTVALRARYPAYPSVWAAFVHVGG
ncbi:CHAT domain-containing protein [Frankia sp. CH37]|nr:CHAT domain-containing protein [Parafrankia sp. CH37]